MMHAVTELVLLSDTEPAEYLVQNIFTAGFAGDFGKMIEPSRSSKAINSIGSPFSFKRSARSILFPTFTRASRCLMLVIRRALFFLIPPVNRVNICSFKSVETLVFQRRYFNPFRILCRNSVPFELLGKIDLVNDNKAILLANSTKNLFVVL